MIFPPTDESSLEYDTVARDGFQRSQNESSPQHISCLATENTVLPRDQFTPPADCEEEPMTMKTPNFCSLTSYQVRGEVNQVQGSILKGLSYP